MIKKSSFIKGGFLIPVIFLIAGFFVSNFSFAYDSNNAHRALTFEIAEFYNYSAEYQLTSQEIEWLMRGAKQEDTPPRWVNHFYNPKTGEGWKGNKLGENNSELVLWFSKWALSQRNPLSAKNWSKNRSAQSEYANYKGDQTWQKAIELYLKGDRESAYIALGHILHLLEDMTVPEHTRADTHAGLVGDKGSPYEAWAKNYTAGKERTLKIAEELKKQGIKLKSLPVLDNYFDFNANYSSKYFFSEDTINSPNFYIPNINFQVDSNKQVLAYIQEDDIYPLYGFKNGKETVKTDVIMSAYWQRLSKRAVISGAGVIKLFHQEVERQSKLPQKITKSIKINKYKFISPVGELAKIRDTITNFVAKTQKFVQNLFPQKAKSEEQENKKTIKQENTNTQEQESTETEEDTQPTQDTIQTEIVSMNLTGPPSQKKPETKKPEFDPILLYYVSRVIDGDTFTLNNGKNIRLIGVDAPEYGKKCHRESKAKLESLILGKIVRIEKDVSETDGYGRFLRYIYLNGVMINAIMLKSGYANLLINSPDRKYVEAFKDYREEAKFFERGCLYSQEDKKTTKQNNNKATIQTVSYLGWSSAGGGSYIDSNALKTTSTFSDTIPLDDTDMSGETGNNTEFSTSTPETPPEDYITPTSTPDGSATSTPSGIATSTAQSIIINEIQIAGQTAKDEFIELYNPTTSTIDISGWGLRKKTKTNPTSTPLVAKFPQNSLIPAQSYFLITHPTGYMGSSTADTTFKKSYYMSKNHTVILQNASSTIIDKVGFGLANDYEEQATLNPPDEQSINRSNFIDTDNNFNDFTIATSTPQNSSWKPSEPDPEPEPEPEPETPPEPPQPWLNCATSTYGTHNKNSGQADKDAAEPFPDFSNTLTVTLEAGKTYYTDDSIVIPASRKLIIEAGVVLKFGKWRQDGMMERPLYLLIQGDLEVNGTASNPVIFTTFRDDQYGVSIEKSKTDPAPADWGAIQIDSSADKSVKIQYAEIYYAGGNEGSGNSIGGAILLNGEADVDISNVKIAHSRAGVYAKLTSASGRPNILNSNFEYNQFVGVKINATQNIAIKLIGNTFQCNGLANGVGTFGAVDVVGDVQNITITNNNFLYNQDLGIRYYTEDGGTLSAENNYWGAVSGPYHPTQNPFGAGDWVSDNIDFTPWTTAQ